MAILATTVSSDLSWASGGRLRLESGGRTKDISSMINFVSSGGQGNAIFNGWSQETWLLMWAMVPSPPQARSMMTGFPLGHLTLEALVGMINRTTLNSGHVDRLTVHKLLAK